MRINGQGGSFPGQDGPRQDSRRSKRFRQGHRPGQKVRGRILEWREDDLAWVEIDGHGLLAQLSRDSALGLERTFLILRLEPEIVLREITSSETGLSIII